MSKSLKHEGDDGSSLVLESSLQSYFFDQLCNINTKSSMPLPKITIWYSSMVMDEFVSSSKFFEIEEGRVRNKILGTKLLETNNMDMSSRKRTLKDIGDTSLFLCGFFSDSLNRRIIDLGYYQSLGRIAYSRLNSLAPKLFNTDSFYKNLSLQFNQLICTIHLISKKLAFSPDQTRGDTTDISYVLSERKNLKIS